jgi:hypothetical protein
MDQFDLKKQSNFQNANWKKVGFISCSEKYLEKYKRFKTNWKLFLK